MSSRGAENRAGNERPISQQAADKVHEVRYEAARRNLTPAEEAGRRAMARLDEQWKASAREAEDSRRGQGSERSVSQRMADKTEEVRSSAREHGVTPAQETEGRVRAAFHEHLVQPVKEEADIVREEERSRRSRGDVSEPTAFVGPRSSLDAEMARLEAAYSPENPDLPVHESVHWGQPGHGASDEAARREALPAQREPQQQEEQRVPPRGPTLREKMADAIGRNEPSRTDYGRSDSSRLEPARSEPVRSTPPRSTHDEIVDRARQEDVPYTRAAAREARDRMDDTAEAGRLDRRQQEQLHIDQGTHALGGARRVEAPGAAGHEPPRESLREYLDRHVAEPLNEGILHFADYAEAHVVRPYMQWRHPGTYPEDNAPVAHPRDVHR